MRIVRHSSYQTIGRTKRPPRTTSFPPHVPPQLRKEIRAHQLERSDFAVFTLTETLPRLHMAMMVPQEPPGLLMYLYVTGWKGSPLSIKKREFDAIFEFYDHQKTVKDKDMLKRFEMQAESGERNKYPYIVEPESLTIHERDVKNGATLKISADEFREVALPQKGVITLNIKRLWNLARIHALHTASVYMIGSLSSQYAPYYNEYYDWQRDEARMLCDFFGFRGRDIRQYLSDLECRGGYDLDMESAEKILRPTFLQSLCLIF